MSMFRNLLTKEESGGGGIDANTLLMLHFDNNYTDSSQYTRTPSLTTSLKYTNARTGKFENAFIQNSENGIITYSTLYDLVEHDFTIDFWIYPISFKSVSAGNGRAILGNYRQGDWVVQWRVFVSEYQGNSKKWGFGYSDGTNIMQLSSTTELVAQQWQHLAVTYNATTRKMELYYNGTKDAETTLEFDMQAPAAEANQKFSIGRWITSYDVTPLSYIDEVRISNKIRYNGNFTPPTEPYN